MPAMRVTDMAKTGTVPYIVTTRTALGVSTTETTIDRGALPALLGLGTGGDQGDEDGGE